MNILNGTRFLVRHIFRTSPIRPALLLQQTKFRGVCYKKNDVPHMLILSAMVITVYGILSLLQMLAFYGWLIMLGKGRPVE